MEAMKNLAKTRSCKNGALSPLDGFGLGTALPSTSSKKPPKKEAAKIQAEDFDNSPLDLSPLASGLTTQVVGETRLAEFFNEDLCQQWILKRLHPGDPKCPDCDATIKDDTTLRNFWGGKRCICKACEKGFKATSGTMLHGMGLSFRDVLLLAALIDIKAGGLDDRRIGELVGVSSNTVKLWTTRFRILSK